MYKLGLVGRQIAYSFSQSYFQKKFKQAGVSNITYENFDLDTIEHLPQILANTPTLKGLNVTIPYKEAVIPYLDHLDEIALEIGAVNTIKVTDKNELIGYNTDYYGFRESLEPLLLPSHQSALILGTGGASKAIGYALKKLGIEAHHVSRTPTDQALFTYNDLEAATIQQHTIIINCTPLGTSPNIEACPNIPYQAITRKHLLYDLIYNPSETQFLKQGKSSGATTCNGLKMLELQAEKSWAIWNLPQ